MSATQPEKHPVVLVLHDDAATWPAPSLVGARVSTVVLTGGTLDERHAQAARAADELGAELHVLASGANGAVAVRMAAERSAPVRGLLLADCDPRGPLADVTDLLPLVAVPTLVISAAPERSDVDAGQLMAGGIDDAVYVVLDGLERPAHQHRPSSFEAWADSFVSIVEGFHALDVPSPR